MRPFSTEAVGAAEISPSQVYFAAT